MRDEREIYLIEREISLFIEEGGRGVGFKKMTPKILKLEDLRGRLQILKFYVLSPKTTPIFLTRKFISGIEIKLYLFKRYSLDWDRDMDLKNLSRPN